MHREAILYSPVINTRDGKVPVVLAKDHPGFNDRSYKERRSRIAQLAHEHVPGEPIPDVDYTKAEHELWQLTCAELRDKHERYACGEFLRGSNLLDLPAHRLPQLNEVSVRLNRLTGFRFSPAAGLVGVQNFYRSLAEPRFQATQYIRHCSMPGFSPEPDMVHDVIGHGTALASARLASLYRLIGQAADRFQSDKSIDILSRIFWFTMEYGLIRENGEIRVLGASLLSSYGELKYFSNADIRTLDLADMVRQQYEVEHYQPVLFCAESLDHLTAFLTDILTSDEQALIEAADLAARTTATDYGRALGHAPGRSEAGLTRTA
jgi:phenylalanine-4-hydroxylase